MKVQFIMMIAMALLVTAFSMFVKSDLKTESPWFWFASLSGVVSIIFMYIAIDRVNQEGDKDKWREEERGKREEERHQELLEVIKHINKP